VQVVLCYNGLRAYKEKDTFAVSTDVRAEIDSALDDLPEGNLRALLAVLRKMRSGPPPQRWSPAVGTVSRADAESMRQAIEEDCERIEPDE